VAEAGVSIPAHRSQIISRLLLIAALLLALALRSYHLDQAEYKLDEANLSRMALDMAAGREIPLRGIGSSVGLPNGPLAVWLLAIPYTFSRSPIVATGFIAILNVLAAAMTYALARRMLDVRAALIAALLFAVAPWAVLNSRKLWAQDLLPPFVVGYLWTGYLTFIKNRRWMLVAHVLLLSACIQLHYSALTFVPLTLLWLVVLWWKRWPWNVIAVALLAGCVSIAPFAYHLLHEGAAALTQAASAAQPARTPVKLDGDALRFAWLMTTGIDLHSLAGPDEFRNYLAGTLNVFPLFHLVGVLTALGLLMALWRSFKMWHAEQARAGFILATALLAPIAMFTVHTVAVYPHYFILTYPAQFMLIGLVIHRLSGQRFLSVLCVSGVIIIAAAQVYAFFTIQDFVGSRFTPGGYGTPVGMMLNLIHTAEERSRALGNAEIIVAGASDDAHADNEAAAFDVLLDPRVPHRFVSQTGAAVYPAGNAVFIHRVLPGQPGPIQLALRTGEGGYNLTDWDGKSQLSLSNSLGDQFLTRLAPPVSLANGVVVWAYHVYGGRGGELRLRLAWYVGSAPPAGADYHWTNQLFDAQGKRVWQKDDVGLRVSNWRAGDLILTDFAAPLDAGVSPGVYTMRVGMYTYPDIKTVATTEDRPYVEAGPIDIQ
jgi:4-amino-4-deoxy-L-arabinose transferase-like glycosyltransferase